MDAKLKKRVLALLTLAGFSSGLRRTPQGWWKATLFANAVRITLCTDSGRWSVRDMIPLTSESGIVLLTMFLNNHNLLPNTKPITVKQPQKPGISMPEKRLIKVPKRRTYGWHSDLHINGKLSLEKRKQVSEAITNAISEIVGNDMVEQPTMTTWLKPNSGPAKKAK